MESQPWFSIVTVRRDFRAKNLDIITREKAAYGLMLKWHELGDLAPISPNFNPQLKLTELADLTKIWLLAFLQHLTDRQLHIILTGCQCPVN